MPSDTNLQEPGADEEPFANKTGTGFDSSAYSEVLDRGLEGIRTPVMPHPERHVHAEAPRKKPLAEAAAKQKQQHSKSKRARHHSPTQPKAPAASLAKSPEACTPTHTRRPLPVAEVSARGTPRRKAAERADASRRATREGCSPPDWSDESETERPRPSSPARPAPAASTSEQLLILESSSESSELSDVNPTASRSRPRRSHAARQTRKQQQPSRGQSPRSEASVTAAAEPEGAAVKEGG